MDRIGGVYGSVRAVGKDLNVGWDLNIVAGIDVAEGSCPDIELEVVIGCVGGRILSLNTIDPIVKPPSMGALFPGASFTYC